MTLINRNDFSNNDMKLTNQKSFSNNSNISSMKLINQNELSKELKNIYLFLIQNDSKWLKTFFIDIKDFFDFIYDDDIHILAYKNLYDNICGVGILYENSILTVAFSKDMEKESCFATVIKDAEELVKKLHYIDIYFGDGYYSYGVYNKEGKGFDNYLEQNGYVLEAVSYDIKHEVSSVKRNNNDSEYAVFKFNYDLFKNSVEVKNPDTMLYSIMNNFFKHPNDTCYVSVKNGERDILGFAFLDADSHVIDNLEIKEMDSDKYKNIKKKLLGSIATDLSSNGIESFIETNVNQIDKLKITNDYEVCGEYKSLCKRIK